MVYVVVVLLTCCAKGTNYETDDLLLTNMTILCTTCVCRNQLVLEKSWFLKNQRELQYNEYQRHCLSDSNKNLTVAKSILMSMCGCFINTHPNKLTLFSMVIG